ncbi:NOB1 family endonuclease [Halorubrum gandharaense]
MQVLDTSAFIHEYTTNAEVVSIPEVHEELEGGHALRFDAMEGSGMRVHVPQPEVIGRVERAAAGSGDAGELSETDVRLIAAALELGATLVTDDYAMQNVAERLDIPVEAIAQEGITEEREWRFQCAGCGRVFDDDKERCPICGSDLSRKNPS